MENVKVSINLKDLYVDIGPYGVSLRRNSQIDSQRIDITEEEFRWLLTSGDRLFGIVKDARNNV